MDEVGESMMRLYRQGAISVTQDGIPVPLDKMPTGPVRIQAISET